MNRKTLNSDLFFITVAAFESFRVASSSCSFSSTAAEASLWNRKSLNFYSKIRLICQNSHCSKSQLSEAFIIFFSFVPVPGTIVALIGFLFISFFLLSFLSLKSGSQISFFNNQIIAVSESDSAACDCFSVKWPGIKV